MIIGLITGKGQIRSVGFVLIRLGTVPISRTADPFQRINGQREELPSLLTDGILPMEDVIKAYYERQVVRRGEL